LALLPQTQDFGNVAPAETGVPYTFTVKNLGGVKSGMPSLKVQPTSAPFAIMSNLCMAPLDPGGTCDVTLTFTAPTTIGQSSAQLVVDGTPGGTASASLLGNSTYVEVTPRSFDFGDVAVGGSGKAQDFTVWHLGPAGSPMIFVMGMVNGKDATEFMTANSCANGLRSGDTCTITLSMTPRTAGAKAAVLDVSAHESTGLPQGTDKATLSGNGL
jgi:hypothetical protein